MPTKKIALEEAFTIEALRADEDRMLETVTPSWGRYVNDRIFDFTGIRLDEMDSQGVDMQVLSLTSPGLQALTDTSTAIATARRANEVVAEVVREYPSRFAAFAALPCQDPDAAVTELDRAVTELGLCGALINGHTHGAYLDEQRFSGLWELAQSLQVPIYIHPADPPEAVAACRGYPLDRATWGWGFETGSHVLRLILSGVFDRFPHATVIVGHMGELLPFNLARLDDRYEFYVADSPLQHPPSHYIKHNVLVTTSGVNDAAALLCTQLAMGADRIMFAVDYPYQRNDEAVAFIDTAPMTDTDRELICHGNAERVLKI